MSLKKKHKIVITGPESTGKSTLCEYLANYYNAKCCNEYAREYVEKLNRRYNYEDVEHIAKMQIEREDKMFKETKNILFVDTSLIITKIWFKIVFNKIPEWFNQKIEETLADFYLLCNTEIEWEKDSVRENGGEMREKLFRIYEQELKNYNVKYEIVDGIGEHRFEKSIHEINEFLHINIF